MDEGELEQTIAVLPRRNPDPRLRARVLAGLPRPSAPTLRLRPLLALAVLVLLAATDLLVMRWQERTLTSRLPVPAANLPPPAVESWWPTRFGLSVAALDTLPTRVSGAGGPYTYLALRKHLANGT